MRIGLLNNLFSGRNDTQVARLLSHLGGRRDIAHVETSSAEAVPEALSELDRQGVELLVVNGGDGTLQHVLTEILGGDGFEGRVPLLAVLRGGRTNMTALDLGTGRDPVRAMARLIEAARKGDVQRRVLERRVLRVQYGPMREVRYGMFFGAGVIHRGIDFLLGHREDAVIVRPPLVRCAAAHRSFRRGSVGRKFDSADAEHVVSETGCHASELHAFVGVGAAKRHERHTIVHVAGCVSVLVGNEVAGLAPGVRC